MTAERGLGPMSASGLDTLLERVAEQLREQHSKPGLIDADAAGELLGLPRSWILEEARHDRIPHRRHGRYVRFDPDDLLDWSRNRARGPIMRRTSENGAGDAHTPRRSTSKE